MKLIPNKDRFIDLAPILLMLIIWELGYMPKTFTEGDIHNAIGIYIFYMIFIYDYVQDLRKKFKG